MDILHGAIHGASSMPFYHEYCSALRILQRLVRYESAQHLAHMDSLDHFQGINFYRFMKKKSRYRKCYNKL